MTTAKVARTRYHYVVASKTVFFGGTLLQRVVSASLPGTVSRASVQVSQDASAMTTVIRNSRSSRGFVDTGYVGRWSKMLPSHVDRRVSWCLLCIALRTLTKMMKTKKCWVHLAAWRIDRCHSKWMSSCCPFVSCCCYRRCHQEETKLGKSSWLRCWLLVVAAF